MEPIGAFAFAVEDAERLQLGDAEGDLVVRHLRVGFLDEDLLPGAGFFR